MKKSALFTVVLGLLIVLPTLVLKSQINDIHFERSFNELKQMIEGEIPVDFERAVYLSEAPYWDNLYSYDQFQDLITGEVLLIKKMIATNDRSDSIDFSVKVKSNGRFDMNNLLYTEQEKKALYHQSLTNWAIFSFLTDSTYFDETLHLPSVYSSVDPFGKKNWRYSQVFNVIGTEDRQGNCYALTSLFKIFSNRLNSNATLCTAPQHIYIQHRDKDGDLYNVELATAGHPSDGQLQTLTYTTSKAIKSGISLRSYNESESIGLLLVQLAKAYERKYDHRSAGFILDCANLALQYDPLNLNALLLKLQVQDERLFKVVDSKGSPYDYLVTDSLIANDLLHLQATITYMYNLGYRPMPIEMQRAILHGYSNSSESYLFFHQDKNPSPFTTLEPKNDKDKQYASLSGGLFTEVWDDKDQEVFGHFIFDTKEKKLVGATNERYQLMLIDPVAFAYDFGARQFDTRTGRWLSRDPLAHKFPSWSPYNGFNGNPIYYTDPDGRAVRPVNKDAGILLKTAFSLYGQGDAKLFQAALGITNEKGVYQVTNYKALGTMDFTAKGLRSHLKDNGIKLSKADAENAYNLFMTIQKREVVELAVFSKDEPGSVTEPGTDGTTVVEDDVSSSKNFKFGQFTKAFDDDQRVLDAVVGEDGIGHIPYEAENQFDPEINNIGTVIIDATGENPTQAQGKLNEVTKKIK